MFDKLKWENIVNKAAVRQSVIITGAVGGMGKACARLYGATHDLILTDIFEDRLLAFTDELRHEGYTVIGAYAGDLADDKLLAAITGDLPLGVPFTLVHTAGLSPSLAAWDKIMHVNLIATEKLLQACEAYLVRGTAMVLIASSAAHMMPRVPAADAVMANPLAPDFMAKIEPLVQQGVEQTPVMGLGGVSYTFSKQAVLDMVKRRAVAWGARARITSISPGMIATPMGNKELAETAGARELADQTPAGRSGTALDIAQAAYFLTSERASFITGCDLQVDGGGVASMGAWLQ